MVQHPVDLDVWSHTRDTFYRSFSKTSRLKVFVNDSLAIKKGNQHAFNLLTLSVLLLWTLERLKCAISCSGVWFPGRTQTHKTLHQ